MLVRAAPFTFFVPHQYEQSTTTGKQQFLNAQPGQLVFFLAQVYADTDAVCTTRDTCPRGWCPPLTTPAWESTGSLRSHFVTGAETNVGQRCDP